MIWLFGKEFTRWIVFPFSVGLLQSQQHKYMNEKLAKEFQKLFTECLEIIKNNMNRQEYLPISKNEYKTFNKSLSKMCDLLDIFSTVNAQLIVREKEKQMRKKRRSRNRISKNFL